MARSALVHPSRTGSRLSAAAVGVVVAVALAACGTTAGSEGDAVETDDDTAAATSNATTPADSEPNGSEDLASLLPEDVRESGEIVVGTPMGIPPGVGRNDDGTPFGIAPDVGEAMGELLEVEFVWEEVEFPGVIPGLQSGRYDISMGVIGDTPERQEVLDFVDLMVNESVLMVVKEDEGSITGLEDLCGGTVGVLAGSLQIQKVEQGSEDCQAAGEDPIEVSEYQDTNDGYPQLQSGRLDAFMSPYLVLSQVVAEVGDGDTFALADARYPDHPWAIGINKGRDELTEALHAALEELVADGTYEQILEEWNAADAALAPDQVMINGAGTPAFE